MSTTILEAPAVLSSAQTNISRAPAVPSSAQNDASPPHVIWLNGGDPALADWMGRASDAVDWDAICAAASRSNHGQHCKALPGVSRGMTHVVRLLQFDDGVRWVARVRLGTSSEKTARQEQAEVDTIAWLHEAGAKERAPVPLVFASEADSNNATGVAYVMLEFLPGNTAMDQAIPIAGGACIPLQFRPALDRSLAAAHVQISSARLPQIGTIVRNPDDGSFTAGPIPLIGGPFDTAAAYIQAWCEHVPIGHMDERLKAVKARLPAEYWDEIVKGNAEFPGRLAALVASGKWAFRDGPFPIRHPDLMESNIVVDEAFNTLGVIDWEHATTVPWELVDAGFIRTMPRLAIVPGTRGPAYDEQTSDPQAPEKAYAEMLREAEAQEPTLDHRLSDTFTDEDDRILAGAMYGYSEGMLGLYGRAMDYLEKKVGIVREPALLEEEVAA